MPCCFKKNRMDSKKKETIDFYKRCMGEQVEGNFDKDNEQNEQNQQTQQTQQTQLPNMMTGDILYVLQDTNKIHENRISDLPKFLEYFVNFLFKKKKEIRNHYLLQTNGYFYKLGIKQENYSFINTMETILGIDSTEIKKIIGEFLNLDTNQLYYLALNDGDIRAEYKINDFINFINTSEYIDYYYLKDILKIPGLFTKNGIFPIVFNKSTQVIRKGNEREKVKEDFYIDIDKTMVTDFEYCMEQLDHLDLLILIKDGKYYYPMVEITKLDENSKNIKITKLFSKDNKFTYLIDEIKKFFSKTIADIKIDQITTHTSAKETFVIIEKIAKKNKEYQIVSQVIDSRFKCKYLITKNNTIIPVTPSGIISNIPTICFNTNIDDTDKMRGDCFSIIKFIDLETTNKSIEKLYNLSDKKLNIKPIGLFYESIDDKNLVKIIGVMTSNNDLIPIKITDIKKEKLDKDKILYQNRPLYHILDQKLISYDKENYEIIDDRIKNVNLSKYRNESFQLFKYELSNLINSKEYDKYKKSLTDALKNKDINAIQDIILEISVHKLNGKVISSKNTVGPELVKIISDIPNVDYYKLKNQRGICSKFDENTCSKNTHCSFHNGECSFALTQDYLLEFIKKLSIELVEQDIKAYELLREKKYFVSDIVDYNNFTEKSGQKIIKSTNTNLIKILIDLFGKEHVPKIGKRHSTKKIELDLQTLQSENPLKDVKDAFKQTIIPYNYTILRAYCNGYYWIKHELYNNDNRNLGFYSELQNEIINIFRSIIIDWLNIPTNIEKLLNSFIKYKERDKNVIIGLTLRIIQ
jgi:hypothetical protein